MTTTARTVAWVKQDPFGVEFAELALTANGLAAVGVAIGTAPQPYRLDYTLRTRPRFVTARLDVTARGQGWRRHLDLRRSVAGVWSIAIEEEGEAPLSPPGGAVEPLEGAVDCDLGLSPVTNSLPVLRHGVLAGGGPIECRMAWVSVPDLGVHADGQRYTFMSARRDRSVIRYEAIDESFTADITFDADGIVLDYPGIAHRLR